MGHLRISLILRDAILQIAPQDGAEGFGGSQSGAATQLILILSSREAGPRRMGREHRICK